MSLIIPEGLRDSELREWLKQKILELDETKRSIRDQIRQFSNEHLAPKTRSDFVWLRKAKAKISFLVEEREELKRVLGDVNQRLKSARELLHSHKRPNVRLAQIFMMLAEDKLNAELFRTLETEALSLLDEKGTEC